MTDVFLGTEDGLIKLQANGGSLNLAARALRGKKVLCGKVIGSCILATCYGDGLYTSDDSGASWRSVSDKRLGKVRCLLKGKWNGKEVLLAGTEPVGLYVSTDQGDSWNEIEAVRSLQEKRRWTYPVPGVDPHVRDVVIDDLDEDTLYVAVQVGGILVGRKNASAWEVKTDGLNPDVHRVVIEPSDRSKFYAATGEEGIFFSEDGGNKWHRSGSEIPWTYTIPFESWGADRLVAGIGKGLPNVWKERSSGAEAVLIISNDGCRSWRTSFPDKPLPSMIMAVMFTSAAKDSLLVGTGVTIGAGVEGVGELYKVNLDNGHWDQLFKDLPGINFITEAQSQ